MRIETADLATPIISKYRNPTGLFDHLPDSLRYWHHTEDSLSKLAASFGYRHVIIPPVDAKSMYSAAFGDTLDAHLLSSGIKEAGEQYVLPAHPRIGMMRSYLESGLREWPPPVRVYYDANTIQKTPTGFAQNHYFCLDCIGVKDITTNATMLVLLRKFAQELHFKNAQIYMHSSGCAECRPAYKTRFGTFAEKHKSELCPICSATPTFDAIVSCETDANAPFMQEAPSFLDMLCVSCHTQMSSMLEACDELDIPYDVDPLLFTNSPEAEQTTFALRVGTESIPAVTGYHYTGLATSLAEEPLAAVGITIDMPRLTRYLEMYHASLPENDGVEVFVAQLGAQAKSKCVPLLQQLFNAGYCAVTASESESITQQLQVAERLNARITLIVGQKEAMNGHVILRDMASGLQDNVYLDELLPALEERLAVVV